MAVVVAVVGALLFWYVVNTAHDASAGGAGQARGGVGDGGYSYHPR